MGYKASGKGTIVLKKDLCNVDTIINMLGEVFSDIYLEKDSKQQGIVLEVSTCENFDLNHADEVLSTLNDITLRGEIHMEGQEGERWRYRFAQDCRKWVEESCFSVFERYDAEKNTCYVPAYVLVKTTAQSEYTEPRYYAAAEDATEVAAVFADREAAEKECDRKNAEFIDDDRTSYSVICTAIKIQTEVTNK